MKLFLQCITSPTHTHKVKKDKRRSINGAAMKQNRATGSDTLLKKKQALTSISTNSQVSKATGKTLHTSTAQGDGKPRSTPVHHKGHGQPSELQPTVSQHSAPGKGPKGPATHRGGVVTPANKYAHVPSRVNCGPPPPRDCKVESLQKSQNAVKPVVHQRQQLQQPAAKSGKKSTRMSHDNFFGPHVKKTEVVKSVLHQSKYLKVLPPPVSDSSSREASTPNEEKTPPTRVSSCSEAQPQESQAAPATPKQSASMSFRDFVLDVEDDKPCRRSISLQQSPRASLRPPAERTFSAVDSARGSAVLSVADDSLESPRRASNVSECSNAAPAGWMQWMMSPLTAARAPPPSPSGRPSETASVVFPLDDDEDANRRGSTRWSVRATFRAPSCESANMSVAAVEQSSGPSHDATPARLLQSCELLPPPPNTPVDDRSRCSASQLRGESQSRMSACSRPSDNLRAPPPSPAGSAMAEEPSSIFSPSKVAGWLWGDSERNSAETATPSVIVEEAVEAAAAQHEGRPSATRGWMERVRTSLSLPMIRKSEERRDESPAPEVAQDPPKRRKSVVFRSPEMLEVRVEDVPAGSVTPLRTVALHNTDAASPVPILVSGPSTKGSSLTRNSSSKRARSDSPSRQGRSSANPQPIAAPPPAYVSGVNDPLCAGAVSPLPKMPSLDGTSPQEESVDHVQHVRSRAVDRHGRIQRSETPATTDMISTDRRLEGSPLLPITSASPSPAPQIIRSDPPPTAEANVESVIRSHTVASALRILTARDIAAFLADNEVVFDPAERKPKLLDMARKLVFKSSRSATSSSSSDALSMPLDVLDSRAPSLVLSVSLSRTDSHSSHTQQREAEDTEASAHPNSSWTVEDIKEFAVSRGVSLKGVAPRKAEYLRHISASFGRSQSSQSFQRDIR